MYFVAALGRNPSRRGEKSQWSRWQLGSENPKKSPGKSRGFYSCVNLESVWRRKLEENAGLNEQLIHRRSVCDNPATAHYVVSELRLVNAAIMSALLYNEVSRE